MLLLKHWGLSRCKRHRLASEAICDLVIAANADKVTEYKNDETAFGFFVGQVMKASKRGVQTLQQSTGY